MIFIIGVKEVVLFINGNYFIEGNGRVRKIIVIFLEDSKILIEGKSEFIK